MKKASKKTYKKAGKTVTKKKKKVKSSKKKCYHNRNADGNECDKRI